MVSLWRGLQRTIVRIIDRDTFVTLLRAANIKPRVRHELRFVSEEVTNWEARDFLAVTNRSRSLGVLILPFEKIHVISFSLQKRIPNKTGRVEAIICDFCATWQRGSNSAIISFTKEDSTQSFLCCADLECSLHVRDRTSVAKISRTQLQESNSIEQRVQRLHDRLGKVLGEV
jgi:hypothetical protein